MMETKLEIQQAIHGYSDGHRKLASSCRLSKDAERQILILSDLSGPGGSDQFDPYLTGYPVESGDYYALARTWAAPEMGRPGCVWTHTLLIGIEELAHLDHPAALLGLFRRPSPDAGFSSYLEPVFLPTSVESDREYDDEWGVELIRALYGGTSPYTVLPVKRYVLAEQPFLSIWRLQWAGLRQCFSFCTGVRSRRSLEGELFYLQAALPRDVRRLDRGNAPLTVIEHDPQIRVDEEWIRIAHAAYVGWNNALIDFFRQIGTRLQGDITLFRPLVQTHAILNRRSSTALVDELIHFAAEEYPRPDSGGNYKRAFFLENLAALSEADLVKGLSTTERYASFDVGMLQMRERGAALWSSEKAWDLLVGLLTGKCNPLGEQALAGLTFAMPAVRLQDALTSPPEVLIGIIRREPRFACNNLLWADSEKQSLAAQALLACREQLIDQSDEIIRAALQAKARPTKPSLIEVFGPASSVSSVLNWLDEDQLREIPSGWQFALSCLSVEMLEWLVSHPSACRATARFVLMTINLEAVAINPFLTEALRRFLDRADTDNAAIAVAARVLQSSLRTSAASAVDLATIAFDVVYHAAADSHLPDDAWCGLSGLLPPAGWWQDWDRCERLRKGIVEKFRTEQWPAWRLVGITKDDQVFAEIVGELRYRHSGRRVLEVAAESLEAGPRRSLMLSE